jgi:hypothetical protein
MATTSKHWTAWILVMSKHDEQLFSSCVHQEQHEYEHCMMPSLHLLLHTTCARNRKEKEALLVSLTGTIPGKGNIGSKASAVVYEYLTNADAAAPWKDAGE